MAPVIALIVFALLRITLSFTRDLTPWKGGGFGTFSTYILARVGPFGALLAIMGLAQCARDRPPTRIAYLASIIEVYLYDWLAWRDWLLAALGPT